MSLQTFYQKKIPLSVITVKSLGDKLSDPSLVFSGFPAENVLVKVVR